MDKGRARGCELVERQASLDQDLLLVWDGRRLRIGDGQDAVGHRRLDLGGLLGGKAEGRVRRLVDSSATKRRRRDAP